MAEFVTYLTAACEAGLGVTVHIAEVCPHPCPSRPRSHMTRAPRCRRPRTPQRTLQLLGAQPARLGRAMFLDDAVKALTCVEICLSSNLLCVPTCPFCHPSPLIRLQLKVSLWSYDMR